MRRLKRFAAIAMVGVIACSFLVMPASANPSTYWCGTHKQTGCTHCASHSMQNVSTASATCTLGGGTVRACLAGGCGAVFYQNPPLGHNNSTSSKICTRTTLCGDVYGSASGWQYMFRSGNICTYISSGYPKRNDGTDHTGIDIQNSAGNQATYNAPVYSVGSGTVLTSELNAGGYGNLVKLSIGNYTVYYAHLNSRSVSTGNSVAAITLVGYAGNTGSVSPAPTPGNPYSGTHLHFELRNSSDSPNNGASAYNPTGFYPSGVFS